MRVQVRRELRDLQQRLGLTTIFVTHDQEEANTVSDRIAVMNDGVVQQVGTPMELYEKPANLFVANFLGTANILPGRAVREGSERFFDIEGAGRVPIPAHVVVPEGARLVFRPQHASLDIDAASDLSLPGTIVHSEFLGSTLRYGVRIGTAEVSIDTPFQSEEALYQPGSSVEIGLSLRSALWLAA
jgi:iron(III) transport system ATP-binding protein